jgi:Fic family protein
MADRDNPRGQFVERTWAPDFARAAGQRAAAGHYEAFIPDKLADEDPQLSAATAALAERAAQEVLRLNQNAANLASLEGLARQLLRSEALASSQIEGLGISHRRLAEAALEGHASHKAQEVLANMRALEEAIALGTRADPITSDDVRSIHRALAAVPPLDRIAGQFREEQGWIGGASPPDADYVGPPEDHVKPLVADLCTFMNRDDIPPVVQAAMAHAQFELIHPFGDGNGRVGRALIHVLLSKRRLADPYVPPISLVFGANKDAYIAGLDNFQAGKMSAWVDQFSRAVITSTDKAAEFSRSVADLQREWRDRLGRVRSDAASLAIIDHLPSFPYITVRIAQELAGRSQPAVARGFAQLEAAGILTRHQNRKKGETWEAKELFDLLDQFEASVRAS